MSMVAANHRATHTRRRPLVRSGRRTDLSSAGATRPTVTVTVQIAVTTDALPDALRLVEDVKDLARRHGGDIVDLPMTPPIGELTEAGERAYEATFEPEDLLEPITTIGPAARRGAAGLRVHPAARAVFLDGEPVALTRREYDLLQFFCDHPRRVFTRAQLLNFVWGYDMVGGERTVDVHVRRLRVKLGDLPIISTVRGVGYRLDDHAPVTLVPPTE
jgi:two-component system, OmpR family, response regulator